ncbi:MAG: hypothetical protein P4L74_00955 [Candidatus Doudnabacteria bacterium]|nr:hypothetical protein [Candidatus Doudnabacteria bacterium]
MRVFVGIPISPEIQQAVLGLRERLLAVGRQNVRPHVLSTTCDSGEI